MSTKTNVARDGFRCAVRVVDRRDGSSIEVGEPDHNFIDIGTTSGVGGEKVVSNVSDDRARSALRPFPGRLPMIQVSEHEAITCCMYIDVKAELTGILLI